MPDDTGNAMTTAVRWEAARGDHWQARYERLAEAARPIAEYVAEHGWSTDVNDNVILLTHHQSGHKKAIRIGTLRRLAAELNNNT